MINIISYESVNGLKFGDGPEKAEGLFSDKICERVSRYGSFVLHYRDIILQF